ncbi:MAG: ABC transporter substrate-binding protein [Rhodospirillales bacterium]|jgi:branched-chain amino acid transport system substrate-binding protein|nr:ABC transporter substrate-binding protein [Rhodospirillaceae bacterium]MDP6426915.1 ABC transporter substrate-binding protein [Rhodospirillales bacterium]MDP6645384.1 ABC transporter substrate-binding protein [Rhodospirillales bacterium]|tara:strand:+ start:1323 stop:2510 length:1188 start_codon:yes stop_codon:yes gene_type:complete
MKTKLLMTAALAALTALPMQAQPASAEDKEVRVGFMNGFPGGRGIFGRDQRDGFLLALDHLGGKLGGLPAKVIIGDTQHKPDVGRQVMDKFIKKDKVHFVVGITWSNVLAAVYKQALKSKTFLISSNAGWSAMDGKFCNPYFFRSSWNNDATPEAMGKALQDENLKSVYLLSANYQAGKDMLTGYLRYYKGKVAGRTLYKLGNSDWQAELSQIRAAKPSAIFAFAPGGMGISLAKQFNAAGLNKKMKLYTVFAVDWMTLKAYGKAAIGTFHTSFWDADSKNPANVRFKRDHAKKYKRAGSMFGVQGYDAALLIDLGIRGANGNLEDHDSIRDAMRTANINSPRGSFIYNVNHSPIQNYYKREVVADEKGNAKIVTRETVFRGHKDAYYTQCKMKW